MLVIPRSFAINAPLIQAMPPAPSHTRRWLQFGLRDIIIWVTPYAALMAWIMAWRDDTPPTNDIFGDAFGEALFEALRYIAMLGLSAVWLIMFLGAKLLVPMLHRLMAKPVNRQPEPQP